MSDEPGNDSGAIRRIARVLCRREDEVRLSAVGDAVEIRLGRRIAGDLLRATLLQQGFVISQDVVKLGGSSAPRTVSGISRASEESGVTPPDVDLSRPWEDALPQVPLRARRALQLASVVTLGELLKLFEDGGLAGLQGMAPRALAELEEILSSAQAQPRLAQPTPPLHPEAEPASVDELVAEGGAEDADEELDPAQEDIRDPEPAHEPEELTHTEPPVRRVLQEPAPPTPPRVAALTTFEAADESEAGWLVERLPSGWVGGLVWMDVHADSAELAKVTPELGHERLGISGCPPGRQDPVNELGLSPKLRSFLGKHSVTTIGEFLDFLSSRRFRKPEHPDVVRELEIVASRARELS